MKPRIIEVPRCAICGEFGAGCKVCEKDKETVKITPLEDVIQMIEKLKKELCVQMTVKMAEKPCNMCVHCGIISQIFKPLKEGK